jgi:RimJ/RimL family protein N-acetyltransferase
MARAAAAASGSGVNRGGSQAGQDIEDAVSGFDPRHAARRVVDVQSATRLHIYGCYEQYALTGKRRGDLVAESFATFQASPGDGDVVGEIHAASWTAAYAGFFDPAFFAEAVRDRRGKWHDRLASEQDTVLLATLAGRPLSFSYFGSSPTRPGWAEIFGFYSHPDGWGTGSANALMTASLSALRENGFARVHLWTLRDTPQARRFYTKSGFTESGAARGHDFGDGNPIDQVEYALDLG